ncbi:MAG: IPTL-CTERM sorting domain-containing protein [Planctomycetes bacterium]|nr:IPTL-CTERM sorting domain-containing protein [Planctomycetota bacterium]
MGPAATHAVQHLEWLGELVDEEAAAPPDDNASPPRADDDGLIGVAWVGGSVKLSFVVTTNYSAHVSDFPAGSRTYVNAWIDWNNNGTFEHPAEYVGEWSGLPPFSGMLGPDRTVGSVAGGAGGEPGTYSIRLRIDWHRTSAHTAAPGGNADGDVAGGDVSYGEVEDYEDRLLEVTGACCFDGATCAYTTQSKCVGLGGEYRGNGTTCSDDFECVPTLSEWGLAVMTILILAAATIVLRNRRTSVA